MSKWATVSGHEEDGAPVNLIWKCRACNVRCANTLLGAGLGRPTNQYNPAGDRRDFTRPMANSGPEHERRIGRHARGRRRGDDPRHATGAPEPIRSGDLGAPPRPLRPHRPRRQRSVLIDACVGSVRARFSICGLVAVSTGTRCLRDTFSPPLHVQEQL